MYYWGNSSNKNIFFVGAIVGILISEGLFHITHHMGRREKTNSGRNRWFLKGGGDRRDILIWLFFRLCAFE